MDVVALHVSDFRHPDGSSLAGQDGLVMAYAVRRPEGVLMVDTGMGTEAREELEPYGVRSRDLASLLAAAGIRIDDVIAVVNCHLHFDHCGQNPLFPGRPIHVQRPEYEAAHADRYTLLDWVDFPGADYRLLDGDAEILPGVRVMATPGHTAGHQSVVLDGAVILAGQAVYTRAEWEGATDEASSGESSAWDRERYRESVARLRALGPRVVYFGHDERAWTADRTEPEVS